MDAPTPPCVILTGVMAAGKSSVADELARTYDRCAHVRGDLFRRWIVAGRDPIAPAFGEEAQRQYDLRIELAAGAANTYRAHGFAVVLQDIYIGTALDRVVDLVDGESVYVVVLAPRPEVVAERERRRAKVGYKDGWSVDALCADFERATPRRGLWLDSSEQTIADTVATIRGRLEEARVR